MENACPTYNQGVVSQILESEVLGEAWQNAELHVNNKVSS